MRAAQRGAVALLLLTVVSCSRTDPSHLTYDADGVAQNVLALVRHNTAWARGKEADAVLYRIELRPTTPDSPVPTDALYSFYSPSTKTFMTATSDPKIPWAGAEPQPWPADRPAPLPLPTVTVDFATAWKQAKDAKIEHVTAAVLEVNTRNVLPWSAWSILGKLPNFNERGVFVNAITGARMTGFALLEAPISEVSLQNAVSEYRGALRQDATDAGGCTKPAVPVPATQSVVCYDVEGRTSSALTGR